MGSASGMRCVAVSSPRLAIRVAVAVFCSSWQAVFAGEVTVKKMREKFAESDTNSDGLLDMEELVAARGQMGHKDPHSSANRVLERWDKDGNTKISVEEYLDGVKPDWRNE